MTRANREDDNDRRIMALLATNARQPTVAIAKKLGLPRTTVHERIERLERNGTITGYRAIFASPAVGQQLEATLLLSIRQRRQSEIVRRLESLPEVRSCASVSGEFDLILVVEAPLSEDLDAVIDEITSLDAVERCMTLIVLAKKFARGE
jgi:DNA-binding Lrp family transcriptional regulator